MTAITVFAKTVGGIAGKSRIHPDIMQTAAKTLKKAEGTTITDSYVTHAADRLILLIAHRPETDLTRLRDEIFATAQKTADEMGLFKNPTPDSAITLDFPEETGHFILFLTGSDTPDTWNKIMLAESGTAKDTGILLAKSEDPYETTARRCEAFAKSAFLGICPVSLCETGIMRTYVTPVAGLGFTLHNGKLTGPVDMFDTPLFDAARLTSSEI